MEKLSDVRSRLRTLKQRSEEISRKSDERILELRTALDDGSAHKDRLFVGKISSLCGDIHELRKIIREMRHLKKNLSHDEHEQKQSSTEEKSRTVLA